jgi:hypothetical protein
MTTTVEVARSPLPADVDQYAGKWVALRNGEVVAAADTLDGLVANEDVLSSDVFYRVPEAGACYY